jgi:hypothetical protein
MKPRRNDEIIRQMRSAAETLARSPDFLDTWKRLQTGADGDKIEFLRGEITLSESMRQEDKQHFRILIKVIDSQESLEYKYKLIIYLLNRAKIELSLHLNADWEHVEKEPKKPDSLSGEDWECFNDNYFLYNKGNDNSVKLEEIYNYCLRLRVLALREDAFKYMAQEGELEHEGLTLAISLLSLTLDEFNVLLREKLNHTSKGETVPFRLKEELADKFRVINLLSDQDTDMYKKYVKPGDDENEKKEWDTLRQFADDLIRIYDPESSKKKESLSSPVDLADVIVSKAMLSDGLLDPYRDDETALMRSGESRYRVPIYPSTQKDIDDTFSRIGAQLLSDNDSYQDLFEDLGLDSEVITQQVKVLCKSIDSGISRLEALDFKPEDKAEFLVDVLKTHGSNRSDAEVNEKSLSEVSIYERTQLLIEQIASQVYSLDMGEFPKKIPLLSIATQEALRTKNDECRNKLKEELVKRIYTQLIHQEVLSPASSDGNDSDKVVKQQVGRKLLALNVNDVASRTDIIVQDVKPCKDESKLLLKLVCIYEDYKAQGGKNKVYNLHELKDVIDQSELAKKILGLNLFPYVDCAGSSSYIDLKKKNTQHCKDELKLKKDQWKNLFLGRSATTTLSKLSEAPPRLKSVIKNIHLMINRRRKGFLDTKKDTRRVKAFFHIIDKEEVKKVKEIQTELMGIVNTRHRVSFTTFGAGKTKSYALKALEVLNEIQRTLGMEECNPHSVQKLRDYAQKDRYKRTYHWVSIGKHHDQRAQALLNVLADCDVSVDIKLIVIEDQMKKISGDSTDLMKNDKIKELMNSTDQNTSFIENVTRLGSHPASPNKGGTFHDCLKACKKYYLELKKQPPVTYDEPAPSSSAPRL